MGRNAQFREKIRRQKERAQARKEQKQQELKKSGKRINGNLVSHKYSDERKAELRNFEKDLLKEIDLNF